MDNRDPMVRDRTFFQKLRGAAVRNESLLCVGLDPSPDAVPEAYRTAAHPIVAWNRAVIEATADLVCAYKPNVAFYEALGDGLATLRATLAAVPGNIPVLLDAKRGDIGSTAAAYARAIFDDLAVDAVTLSPYLGADSIAPFAAYTDRGLFVLCHTSNPGAAALQELAVAGPGGATGPLYLEVARQALTWSDQDNIGLVVGATFPEALSAVRALAPQAWFLVPGVGTQGGDLEAAVTAGLRADGFGIIVNASRAVAQAADPRRAAQALRDAINGARRQAVSVRAGTAAAAAASPVPDALIARLHALGAIGFGDFTLASGQQSPIYIDLRLLVGDPGLLRDVARAYATLLADIPCDRLAAVPYAALPIGTALSLATGKPLIYPRKEVKSYGLGKAIEGVWQPGERAVVIEDLVTSGGSTQRTVDLLRDAGLLVSDVVVLLDREQGGRAALAAAGLALHAVFTLSQALDSLVAQGVIGAAQRAEVHVYLKPHAPNT